MNLLSSMSAIVEEGKILWEICPTKAPMPVEHFSDGAGNSLVLGDNLSLMKHYVSNGLAGKIDMIYVDPPFYSKADYKVNVKIGQGEADKFSIISQKAYKDSWENGLEDYLKMLTARLYAFRELLSDRGSLWIHLDWHAVHYIKIIMDHIFGEKNFVNEVIWTYKSGGAGRRRFSRKHDSLLFYSKSQDYYFKPLKEKSYNRNLQAYNFKGVKEYKDDIGWYTLVNMKDVWNIDMVGRTSSERVAYATQKPEKLLERIIQSTTKEGDVCADFFAGSSTLAAVASKLNRRYISCDESRLAIISSQKRLLSIDSSFTVLDSTVDEIKEDGDFQVSIGIEDQHVSVLLKSYDLPKASVIPISPKDMGLLAETLKTHSIHLVDYWSVDFDYDGHDFRPDVYKLREKDRVDNECIKLGKSGSRIGVRVVDIFGNASFKVYGKE